MFALASLYQLSSLKTTFESADSSCLDGNCLLTPPGNVRHCNAPPKMIYQEEILSSIKKEFECFIGVFRQRETDETTRPKAECFYCFEVSG